RESRRLRSAESGLRRNQQRAYTCRGERRKCFRKFLVGAGLGNEDTLIGAARCLFNLRQLVWGKARIEQNANQWNARHQVTQQPEPLWLHDISVQRIAGRVATGVVKALDQSLADLIAAYTEYDGDTERSARGRAGRGIAADGDEHAHPTADEIGRHRRQQVVLTARPAELDRHVLALDVTTLGQTSAKGCKQVLRILRRARAHETY